METFKWITKSIALQFFSKTKEFKVSRLKTLLWKIKKKKTKNLSLITIKLLDLFSKKSTINFSLNQYQFPPKNPINLDKKFECFKKLKKRK